MLVVVAVEEGKFDVRCTPVLLKTELRGVELRRAVVRACTEYARTPKGKKMYDFYGGCFNWTAFAKHVPNTICARHGFTKCCQSEDTMIVDADDHLVNDDEIEEN